MDGLKTPDAETIIKTPAKTKTGLAEYRRIEIALRELVGGGRWAVGAMLPSRRELARQYAVSLVTLDRAIGPLLADGTLRADDRRGTFVLKPPAGPPREVPEAPAARPAAPKAHGLVGIITSVPTAESQENFILHELEQVLSHRGLSTAVLNRIQDLSDLSRRRGLADSVRSVLGGGVDALIVVCLDIDRTQVAAELGELRLGAVPAVCILAGELTLPIPHVFYDNRSGGHQAARHLSERGWREITVVAPFSASWVSERIAGVRDAAQGDGAGGVQVLAGDGRDWQGSRQDPRSLGYETARAALAAGWRPAGGVICVSDGVALGVLDAAAEWHLEAGKDFGILGFDDEPAARTLGLTSLRPPMQGMAREAARLLLDQMQGADTGLQVRLRAHVIPRASTAPRRPA